MVWDVGSGWKRGDGLVAFCIGECKGECNEGARHERHGPEEVVMWLQYWTESIHSYFIPQFVEYQDLCMYGVGCCVSLSQMPQMPQILQILQARAWEEGGEGDGIGGRTLLPT